MESGFISAGGEDGMVAVWGNAEVVGEGAGEGEGESEGRGRNRVKFPDESTVMQGKGKETGGNMKLGSQTYMDEIMALDKFVCDKLMLKDSQI